MQIGLLFRILRSRFWLIAAVIAITTSAALVGSLIVKKRYSATADLHVDVRAIDPVSGQAVYTQQSPQQYLATQVDIIKSERVIDKVIATLDLERHPILLRVFEDAGRVGTMRDAAFKYLTKNLSVSPSIDASTIRLSFEAQDPRLAADTVNAFTKAFVDTVVDLKAEPASQAATWFEGEAQAARKAVQVAQGKMSSFQQQSGIISQEERYDVEMQSLNEKSSRLVQLQADAEAARARLEAIRQRGRDAMPEVVSNQLIQTLKTEVARSEAKLGELASRLGPNNPEIIVVKAEADSLRARLAQEVRQVGASIEADAAMILQREGALSRDVATQRERVLELKTKRDQLTLLQREVDSAQKSLDQLMQRAQDTKVSSRATLTNVAVLSAGEVPLEPSRPKPVLNTIIGMFLGGLLGVMAALVIEAMQRPVRTADDLLQFSGVPVLAVLPPAGSNKPQRLIGGAGPNIRPPALGLRR